MMKTLKNKNKNKNKNKKNNNSNNNNNNIKQKHTTPQKKHKQTPQYACNAKRTIRLA